LISIVIITKNEEAKIGNTIKALLSLSDDIIIVDSFSTDRTVEIAKDLGAQVIQTAWLGYGATKNLGHQYTKNSWVLSIDADEVVDATLAKAILQADLKDIDVVYKIKRVTNCCGTIMKHGTFNAEYIPRLFHKETNYWSLKKVHEVLISKNPIYKTVKGSLIHHTINSIEEYDAKNEMYASLAAEEMYKNGRKASWVNLYINPTIKFIKDYYLNAGFLEGKMGFIIAKKAAYTTYLKYKKLQQLNLK
jgi:glycosyltransferase involved in cell wall biosynthesis